MLNDELAKLIKVIRYILICLFTLGLVMYLLTVVFGVLS